MNTDLVVKIKSDNFNCFLTVEAYKEIRLQMSTGDFHTHEYELVTVDLDDVYVINLDEIKEEC